MATRQLATIKDLEDIPDSACRHELIRGEIIEMAPAGGKPGEIGMLIGTFVTNHVRTNHLGTVYNSDTGFVIERDPDTVFAPDAAFVSAERLPPDEERIGFMPVVPDLAVEVISPSDRAGKVTEKAMIYLNAGVKLVWLVHPEQKLVTVYTPDKVAHTFDETDTLDGGEVLPEFRLPVTEIFEW